ncbi:MAG: hypothetical protein DRJ05_11310 [Bacteroidetes bacterium]|nr:MAG: hypothetical protein DRJ05_11310 [Bacteroidota bacterium]
MDFTIKTHEDLIKSLSETGIPFLTFSEYLQKKDGSFIMLRHDVEQRYENALEFAKIQHTFKVKGTYFFRILKNHFKADIVKQIAGLGHEVGYHYDDLAQSKGDFKKAIKRFEKHLNLLRNIAPVETICMDGSPLSKYDNKSLWDKYNYRDFGIIGEPYFDIDFKDILYLTDTGRCWDGERYSIRDKVNSSINKFNFHSTKDIIKAINNKKVLSNFPERSRRGVEVPERAMFTFHPQRWNDKMMPWLTELVLQNVKNQVKKVWIKR